MTIKQFFAKWRWIKRLKKLDLSNVSSELRILVDQEYNRWIDSEWTQYWTLCNANMDKVFNYRVIKRKVYLKYFDSLANRIYNQTGILIQYNVDSLNIKQILNEFILRLK